MINTHHLLFTKRKNGQGMAEYLLIAALIAIACMGIFQLYGKTIHQKMSELSSKIFQIETNGGGFVQNVNQIRNGKSFIEKKVKMLRNEATRLTGLANLQAFSGLDSLSKKNMDIANALRISAAAMEAQINGDPKILELEYAKIAASSAVAEAIGQGLDLLPKQVQWVVSWVKLPIQDGVGQLTELGIERAFK